MAAAALGTPSPGSAKITISPDVLRQLAEAEAKRAEAAGSSASSKEMQSKLADSIERIVEQVGAGCRATGSDGRWLQGY